MHAALNLICDERSWLTASASNQGSKSELFSGSCGASLMHFETFNPFLYVVFIFMSSEGWEVEMEMEALLVGG
jgi:hypothetical protein